MLLSFSLNGIEPVFHYEITASFKDIDKKAVFCIFNFNCCAEQMRVEGEAKTNVILERDILRKVELISPHAIRKLAIVYIARLYLSISLATHMYTIAVVVLTEMRPYINRTPPFVVSYS